MPGNFVLPEVVRTSHLAGVFVSDPAKHPSRNARLRERENMSEHGFLLGQHLQLSPRHHSAGGGERFL